jgi:hypothetical protein
MLLWARLEAKDNAGAQRCFFQNAQSEERLTLVLHLVKFDLAAQRRPRKQQRVHRAD